ncbi:hypothetical protein ABZP36_024674 [Zizania latifolia]
MAAYGKQQPQAPLNDAYYGPAIPPPPAAAYYGSAAPSAPRRSGPRCLFCFLFKIIAIAIIALGAVSLVLWLIFRPSAVKAYADTATLSRFDLDAGRRGMLQYNLTVGMRVRNPNRFGINYRRPYAQAFYDGKAIADEAVQPFYLGRKSDSRFTLSFNGTSALSDDNVEEYRKETRQGSYEVKVRVHADLDFKVRGFKVKDNNSKITCKLLLPLPSGNGTASATPTIVYRVATKCDVDFSSLQHWYDMATRSIYGLGVTMFLNCDAGQLCVSRAAARGPWGGDEMETVAAAAFIPAPAVVFGCPF